jgi:hypothetical protein
MPRPWNPRQAYEEEPQFVLDCTRTFLSVNFAKILPWQAGTRSSLSSRRTGAKTSLAPFDPNGHTQRRVHIISVSRRVNGDEFLSSASERRENKFMWRRLWKQATAPKKGGYNFFFLTIKEATTLSMDLLIPVACVTMLHAVRAWASWKLPFSQLTNKCKLGTVNHRAGTMFKDLLCVTIQKQM